MKTIAMLCLAPFFAVSAETVAYQSWVDGRISTVQNQAREASDKVKALEKVVIGDDFAIMVTNYDSKTKMSAASFKFKREDGTWYEVWNDLNRWKWFFDEWVPTNIYTKSQANARFAEKAWGQYSSGLGEESPDGRLWLTQPVVVSSGLEWVPFSLESSGSIWVLTANGLTPGESTGESGSFLRITDDSGKEVFKIEKGDKELVGAYCEGIRKDGNTLTLQYKVDSTKSPTLEGCVDLSAADWKDPTEHGCTVSWSGGSGDWMATVEVPPTYTKFFLRAKFEKGKEPSIVNAVPVKISGGILTADGVKIRPVVNGATVTWEVFE